MFASVRAPPPGTAHRGRRTGCSTGCGREEQGAFVLRIEDTTSRAARSRAKRRSSTPQGLGLDWARADRRRTTTALLPDAAARNVRQARGILDRAGQGVPCDCTKEELDRLREQAAREKRGFKYPAPAATRTCRGNAGSGGPVPHARRGGEPPSKTWSRARFTTQHKELQRRGDSARGWRAALQLRRRGGRCRDGDHAGGARRRSRGEHAAARSSCTRR